MSIVHLEYGKDRFDCAPLTYRDLKTAMHARAHKLTNQA